MELNEFVAKRIRFLRLKEGLTQAELAEKADLGFNYVYRLENKNTNVKIDTIEKIIQALNIDIETFFDTHYTTTEKSLVDMVELIETLPLEKQKALTIAVKILIEQMK